jgi:hypothetical protein
VRTNAMAILQAGVRPEELPERIIEQPVTSSQ